MSVTLRAKLDDEKSPSLPPGGRAARLRTAQGIDGEVQERSITTREP